MIPKNAGAIVQYLLSERIASMSSAPVFTIDGDWIYWLRAEGLFLEVKSAQRGTDAYLGICKAIAGEDERTAHAELPESFDESRIAEGAFA